jgi:endonuclease/exonuclease/phosphatase (EEP) superfamily protein YafD
MRWIVLSGFGLLVLAGCSGRKVDCLQTVDGGSEELRSLHTGLLRVLTYNIYVGNADLAATAQSIIHLRPDLAVLQEVNQREFDALEQELESVLPHHFFPASTQDNVVALFSRLPLRNPRYEPSHYGLNGFAFAEIEFLGHPVQLAAVHLDPIRAWTLTYKLTLPWQVLHQGWVHRHELDQVLEHFQPGAPSIILGDFNSYASDAGPHYLQSRGLVDSARSVCNGADDVATQHFSVLGRSFGRRIDFIFHSTEFRTAESRVVRGDPSDHDIVVSSLQWANAPAGEGPN